LQRYDALICPHAKPKELLFAGALSGIKRRVAMWAGMWGRLTGYQCLRSGLLNDPRHISDIWLDCARALGAQPYGLMPDYFLDAKETAWAKEQLWLRFGKSVTLRVVGIHPGCGGNTCNLPTDEYGKLAGLLLQREGYAVVATGSSSERKLVESWPETVLKSPRFWNSTGELSVRQLAAILAQIDVFVCVGTGPLHVASALGKCTVSPFCPYVGVSPQVWGNLGATASAAIEPPHRICSKITHGSSAPHCDFKGAITAQALLKRVDTIVSSLTHDD